MTGYLLAAEGLTTLWVVLCLFFTIHLISRGRRDSLLFVLLVFLGTYGITFSLDLFLGMPEYSQQPVFFYAGRDEITRFLYCVFLWITPVVWFSMLHRRSYNREQKAQTGKVELTVFLVMMVLPFVLVAAAPSPLAYLHYARIALGQNVSDSVLRYHSIVAAACMGSIIAIGGIIATASDWKLGLLATLPFLALANYLGGKRFSVAFSVVLLLYVLWQRAALTGRKLRWSVVGALLCVGAFSYMYEGAVRHVGANQRTAYDFYDDLRVDFGRDSRVQTAIFAELNPTYQILDYRGESFLFCLLAPIPRTWWSGKPYPYSVYFTSAMLGRHEAAELGWGMTTGFLDESIANLSWLGILSGPVLIGLFCRYGDSFSHPFMRVLTGLIGALLLTLQIPAFFSVIFLWLFFVLRHKLLIAQVARGLQVDRLRLRQTTSYRSAI